MTDYERHFNFLASISNPKDISEETINDHLRLLLSILPNNGKLYKYRSLIGESFENTYESLEKGYMWIGQASKLNDDADSIFVGNPEQSALKAVDYLFSDQAKFFYAIIKKCRVQLFQSYDELKSMPFDEINLCFDAETKELDEEKAANLLLKYCQDIDVVRSYVKSIGEQINLMVEDLQTRLADSIKKFYILNYRMREAMHVFSMSESYDLSNLWGYYADSGKGFCIEYDYNRAITLAARLKMMLLNTQKVEYDDSPVDIDLECLLEKYFFENDISILPFTKSVMHQALRKEKCWEHEREWRITLGITDSQVPIDIVSGVIIDERSIETENAKKLIQLCKKRNWSVKIRKCNVFQTAHSYEDYIEQEAQ